MQILVSTSASAVDPKVKQLKDKIKLLEKDVKSARADLDKAQAAYDKVQAAYSKAFKAAAKAKKDLENYNLRLPSNLPIPGKKYTLMEYAPVRVYTKGPGLTDKKWTSRGPVTIDSVDADAGIIKVTLDIRSKAMSIKVAQLGTKYRFDKYVKSSKVY